MSLEVGLLVLETVLLVFTILLLIFSIKEGRGRKSLLLEVERATKVLTREEYFLTIMDSLADSNKEVIGTITGRFPSAEDRSRVKNLASAIEKLSAQGVKIIYLLPKFPDRLHIGYLYSKAGAEIRYSDCLIVHDLRYMIVDRKVVIIGVPESIGEKEATRKGYKIPSEALAHILYENFHSCLENSVSFEEFLKEVIKQTGAPIKILAKELQIEEDEIKKYLSS